MREDACIRTEKHRQILTAFVQMPQGPGYDIDHFHFSSGAMQIGSSIMITFTVPTATHDSTFDLYAIKTYPMFSSETGKCIGIGVQQLIGLMLDNPNPV